MNIVNQKIKARILVSIPSTSHIEIAIDELMGLKDCGYISEGFDYAGRDGVNSKIGRLLVVLKHTLSLIVKAYDFKPDIIYFNSRLEILGSSRDFLTIMLFKFFYFKKVLFMVKSHGSDLEVLASQSYCFSKIILPFLRKHVAAWLFLSTEEKQAVVDTHYFNQERIFVTKNIVRTSQFVKDDDFRFKLGIMADQTILLFTGRLIREKGVYEVIDAFERLVRPYKLILIIVGDGAELAPLKILAQRKSLADQVIFTGFIPEQEVVSYYANADILVFPTYFPEGFPMALFNAVAAGMAIVTTKIRAAKDYLFAPDNCLWVRGKDSSNLEAAIAMLLESPELIQRMRTNNLDKGRKFSQEVVCKEISLVIEALLTVTLKPNHHDG